jgi:hypothetical protein
MKGRFEIRPTCKPKLFSRRRGRADARRFRRRIIAMVDKDSPRRIAGGEKECFAKLSLPVRVAFRYDDPPHFFVTLL